MNGAVGRDGIRHALEGFQSAVEGEAVTLCVDVARERLDGRRLAGLARRVHDKVVAARNQFADAAPGSLSNAGIM